MALESKISEATPIHDVALRGISWKQLVEFASAVSHQLDSGSFIDLSYKKFDLRGDKVLNPNNGKPLRFQSFPEASRVSANESETTLDPIAHFSEINMYEVVEHFIKPWCAGNSQLFPNTCSYVEAVASGPQAPELFVSHFWGEKVRMLLDSMQVYVRRQSLSDVATFWLCSHAHRLHCLSEELSKSLHLSSFHQALQLRSTRGTLLVTTNNALAFNRLWCLYEVHESITKPSHRLDICVRCLDTGRSYVWHTAGGGHGLSQSIPDEMAEILLYIRARDAETSSFDDGQFLLEAIEEDCGLREFANAIQNRLAGPGLSGRAARGETRLVEELLLKAGCNTARLVSYCNVFGTPLHQAAMHGHNEVCRVLLRAEADINSQAEQDGNTPLMKSSFWGKLETAALLLRAMADMSCQNHYGQTALGIATKLLKEYGSRAEMVQLFRLAEVSEIAPLST